MTAVEQPPRDGQDDLQDERENDQILPAEGEVVPDEEEPQPEADSDAADEEGLENPGSLSREEKSALLCAVLFSAGEVVDSSRLCDFLLLDNEELMALVEDCNSSLAAQGLSVMPVAGGYRMMTTARWGGLLSLYHRRVRKARLSKSALEILAIIAYEQPVSRTRVDELRQVNSESTVRSLLERRLITIAGRAETPGRPFLYRTTAFFLESFGLLSLEDLPPRPATLDFSAGDSGLEGPFASEEELDSLGGDEADLEEIEE
jgi:segregation and condensation protein B